LLGGILDDTLTGGEANDILLGEGGDDKLFGEYDPASAGTLILPLALQRDILIGGAGADVLRAGIGDDILISGATVYSPRSQLIDRLALDLIRRVWSNPDANLSYDQRVTAIFNGAGNASVNRPRLTPSPQPSPTLINDGVRDQLFGEDGQDWFLAGMIDTVDQMATANETKTDIN
jgi:Ca2+-binding RTX toxin-like protein